jgi:thiamine-monophosphate kinase
MLEGRMKTSVRAETGELALLREIRRRARSGAARAPGVVLGIGDDCALLRPRPGEEIAVTTDLSIDGRHFRLASHPPEAIGHRVLACGLSDLAAMGARPLAAFVSMGLPAALASPSRGRPAWVGRFYDGLFALARQFRTPLAGGDLAESPVALADIVLVGAVPKRKALRRSGARPDDGIYVTGALGGSAAGLALLDRMVGSRLPARLPGPLQVHLFPQPRIVQGQRLRQRGLATAAIDISDGLSTDLAHLCEESSLSAEIDAGVIPVARGATLDQALHGGEDYELLFTAPAAARVPRAIAGVPVTRVGRMLRRRAGRPQIALLTANGVQPLETRGWQHFA